MMQNCGAWRMPWGDSMNAAGYKHVVLALIFLKYISDAFEEHRKRLEHESYADLEDPDEYRGQNVFWMPPKARWECLQKDWKFGVPPLRNANFAWGQHIIHHLAPTGYAGFVLANGSMSSNQSGEGEIRKNIIEADLVDCMVALPDKLFYSTQIPACLWFLARDKSGRPPTGRKEPLRDRRGEILFIDARRMGKMVDRIHRELTDEEIQRIARTYHAWRGEKEAGAYQNVPGFCKSTTLDEVRKHGYVLTPGRYVGAEVQQDDEPFEEKMARLVAELREQQAEAARLDEAIWKNLKALGYDA
ncbi:MAG: hypothetical protein KatS3mg006_2214 [Pyrinomonadaceae bacterium]|nr:MAG: hypothetical protein KatS3mg006_2214 [Pyrinomonadaceae bacterium]